MLPSRKKLELLEGVRGLAAIYVLLGHLVLIRLHARSSSLGLFFQFGQEAVIAFFVLSGFVIHYTVSTRPAAPFKDYLLRRAVRIFPIYLLAIAVSWNGFSPVLLGNLAMLQDFQSAKPGVWFTAYGGNGALWSLSYEWWFYMMYWPVQRYVPATSQRKLVAGISLLGVVSYVLFPSQIGLFLTYFSIWWVGVEFARTYLRGEQIRIRNQAGSLAILSTLAAVFLGWTFWQRQHHVALNVGFHPILELRHLTAAVVILLVGCSLSPAGLHRFKAFVRPFSIVAPFSYALYVLHMPLLVTADYLGSVIPSQFVLFVYGVVLFAVAIVMEGKVQKAITGLVLGKSKSSARRDSSSNQVTVLEAKAELKPAVEVASTSNG